MRKLDLLHLIESKRTELTQIVSSYGLSSSLAIRYSQELDHLLNEYHRIYIKKISACS